MDGLRRRPRPRPGDGPAREGSRSDYIVQAALPALAEWAEWRIRAAGAGSGALELDEQGIRPDPEGGEAVGRHLDPILPLGEVSGQVDAVLRGDGVLAAVVREGRLVVLVGQIDVDDRRPRARDLVRP